MADCSNVEIREMLPERVGGALSAADTARVDAHLASCALCRSELALIQAARRVLRVSPSIDVARIASAVVSATAAPSRPQLVPSALRAAPAPRGTRLRWVGWKAAAAIAIAAAGVGTLAVWRSANEPIAVPNGAAVAAPRAASATRSAPGAVASVPSTHTGTAPLVVASANRPASAPGPAELGLGGALSDLSAGDLETLLGDLGVDGGVTPVNPSFEEPDMTEPSVGIIPAWESR